MSEFMGRAALVTGGARGIGRAIVLAFLREGASVVFIDPAEDEGRRLASEHPGARFVPGDITRAGDLDRLFDVLRQHAGRVDFLVNNACFSRGGILSACSPEDFDAVLAVGVRAPYELSRRCLPLFPDRDACIVNIGSSRALMSQPDTESYSAAKGGILALTHALAVSLGPRVRVHCVSPGWIDTRPEPVPDGLLPEATAAAGAPAGSTAAPVASPPDPDRAQHPAGRIGRPADIAELVLFLCSSRAGFITGQNLLVDGGMTRTMIYHGDGGWTFAPATQDSI